MCTFDWCQKADHLFDSRREWFEHELVTHRREWYCNNCDREFRSRPDFQDHLRERHRDPSTLAQLQTITDRCERSIEAKQQCPFCGEVFSPGMLERHLARHMQQISLFVLRGYDKGVEDDADSNNPGSRGACIGDSDEESQTSEGIRELEFDSDPSDVSESDEGGGLPDVESKRPNAAWGDDFVFPYAELTQR